VDGYRGGRRIHSLTQGIAVKTTHIAFISAPIAACLNPIVPLLSVLVRRGYKVTCATSEPFVSRVSDTGAEVVEYEYGAFTAKYLNRYSYCRLAEKTIAGVERFYERCRPDIVAYDFVALAGRLLAQRWHVPAIRTGSDFAFNADYIDQQISYPQLRERALERSADADKFLNAHGVKSQGYLFHREKLNLFLFPREFEPCIDGIDESCVHVGRCAGEQVGIGEWKRPESSLRPIILVAPSRSYAQGVGYYRMCIAALSGLGYHVVLSIDDEHDGSELRPLPDNFEIVQRVSHTKVMPHAVLVIGMAGTAATAEAAYHGLPVVMTSCGALELEWSADNLLRLGIGVHIRNAEMSADRLRSAVLHVLGSSVILSNVSRLQQSVRRQPGAEEAANRIDEFAELCRGNVY
jgi:MGT family glycosyltransferase